MDDELMFETFLTMKDRELDELFETIAESFDNPEDVLLFLMSVRMGVA